MKKFIFSLVIFMIIFISGCSYFNIYSNSLIFDSEKIDTMYIFILVHGENYKLDTLYYPKSVKGEQINAMANLLKSIRLKKLSTTQVKKIMEDIDSIRCYVTLVEEIEQDPYNIEPKGGVYVMKNDYLVFVDPQTIDKSIDKSFENTDYFISTEKQSEIVKEINKIIKEGLPFGF